MFNLGKRGLSVLVLWHHYCHQASRSKSLVWSALKPSLTVCCVNIYFVEMKVMTVTPDS